MLALLGDEGAARRIAAEHGLTVANDNAPGQLVVSGPEDDLQAAGREARSERLKAMPLSVRGAFHTEAMAPALPAFREALEEIDVGPPRIPVFSSVTAQPFDEVRRELAAALVRPVRWRETLIALRERGVERFVEVGPGRVLKGLVRRTLPEVEVEVLAAPEVAHA